MQINTYLPFIWVQVDAEWMIACIFNDSSVATWTYRQFLCLGALIIIKIGLSDGAPHYLISWPQFGHWAWDGAPMKNMSLCMTMPQLTSNDLMMHIRPEKCQNFHQSTATSGRDKLGRREEAKELGVRHQWSMRTASWCMTRMAKSWRKGTNADVNLLMVLRNVFITLMDMNVWEYSRGWLWSWRSAGMLGHRNLGHNAQISVREGRRTVLLPEDTV